MPKDLEVPEVPFLMARLWDKFSDLSRTRPQGMNGPLPISYSEIRAWSELTGETLSLFEVDVIKKLDNLYLRISNSG